MRLKEVAQVTFLAALPIFALEVIAHYRAYKRKLRAAEELRKRAKSRNTKNVDLCSDDEVSLVESSLGDDSIEQNTVPVTTDLPKSKKK